MVSCNAPKTTVSKKGNIPTDKVSDTIRIVNEELEYEIIIIDIGFDSWLVTQKPITYYSNSYLKIKNDFYVVEWNIRVNQPFEYDPHLYEMSIDYDPNIDYGIEVNYKLFMYFQFFQQKYRQRLR
jgi:hypothetical protein